jgi:hypothetical protein
VLGSPQGSSVTLQPRRLCFCGASRGVRFIVCLHSAVHCTSGSGECLPEKAAP